MKASKNMNSKKGKRRSGPAKAACPKKVKPENIAEDVEDTSDVDDPEIVDDDDESDPIFGGIAGALLGGAAGLVIGGVLGAMAEAFKSAVDDDGEDEEDEEDADDEEDDD